jgi:hypothetical protein
MRNRGTVLSRGINPEEGSDTIVSMLQGCVLLNSEVKCIAAGHVELLTSGETAALPNDFVFVLIGGEPPGGISEQSRCFYGEETMASISYQ